ncbi:C4-dicarboxylate-specific signal transduction histidine kinase [Ensifer adhaerens]|uniref:C4-dicarboxylate-specific signal transduction histidine kinase n=1 Tax=Ensifer adhaerens TaxID=106592 RepID=A0ACC5SS11_ENSAD|nr:ATP-binding protein [Ensifer adhaerens]MBP1871554.1 C4-dicarboxylate-specific signal transduction histidine kinase [Ensifer adhaerens]
MSSGLLKSWLFATALWLAAVLAFAFYSIESSRQRLGDELTTAGRTLHRLISQRAAQHDAHMTSLIALADDTEPARLDATRQVMESVARFYPRIAWLALVSLDEKIGNEATLTAQSGNELVPLIEVPFGKGEDLSPLRDAISQQQPGKVSAYVGRDGHYLLAKRAQAPSDTALVLSIDARHLLEPEERPRWAHLTLTLDNHLLVDLPAEETAGAAVSFVAPAHFESTIDSASQRISLSLDRPMPTDALLPIRQLIGFAAMAGLASFALMFALRQRAAVQKSRMSTEEAEARALLQERQALLAHASRVNAMGELASGIAHELTQPLTAMLSRSQAALRLASADKPDIGLISEALEVNVREAKRAGEMLRRMRDYASNRTPEPVTSAINDIVAEIAALTGADLQGRDIRLKLDLTKEALVADVDPIELEQVLHNLIRNAADALEDAKTADPLVEIETRAIGDEMKIIVRDNGPGIAATAFPKLFQPFFTTKADGMGLGLSLCATLVERVDGRIEAENAPDGGAWFTITLPRTGKRETL